MEDLNSYYIYSGRYKKFIEGIISKRGQWYIPESGEYIVHHIIPRCMGGLPTKINRNKKIQHPNLIFLTPKEHYIAHRILTHSYPNDYSFILAFMQLAYTKDYYCVKSAREYTLLYGADLIDINMLDADEIYIKRLKKKRSDSRVYRLKEKNTYLQLCKKLKVKFKDNPSRLDELKVLEEIIKSYTFLEFYEDAENFSYSDNPDDWSIWSRVKYRIKILQLYSIKEDNK